MLNENPEIIQTAIRLAKEYTEISKNNQTFIREEFKTSLEKIRKMLKSKKFGVHETSDISKLLEGDLQRSLKYYQAEMCQKHELYLKNLRKLNPEEVNIVHANVCQNICNVPKKCKKIDCQFPELCGYEKCYKQCLLNPSNLVYKGR